MTDPIIAVHIGSSTWQGPASQALTQYSPIDRLIREIIKTDDLDQLAHARNAISQRMQEIIDQQLFEDLTGGTGQ